MRTEHCIIFWEGSRLTIMKLIHDQSDEWIVKVEQMMQRWLMIDATHWVNGAVYCISLWSGTVIAVSETFSSHFQYVKELAALLKAHALGMQKDCSQSLKIITWTSFARLVIGRTKQSMYIIDYYWMRKNICDNKCEHWNLMEWSGYSVGQEKL
jgi:hypothetical protein